ncbi:hemicentin-1-like [Choristoneura fumiferana]|uniref:hemicentin-1-like n=1 Tax=Choristoneura fumiferana TaxID=7141 RepID=UPI003D1543AE
MFKIVQIILVLTKLAFLNALDSNEVGNDKSSLVFVFDTTGSMYNDLKQLREGAEMILRTALEESDIIEDFVFVPFHDPAVGPATVTRDKAVFQAALNIIRVYGGGDCPEKSLTGIQLALNVSRPRSFVYVFTDATANDHRLVGRVLDLVQRKESQVVFVLTGHCNDLKRPSYLVYQQIAAASSGQVFNLNKTNVHKVLDFVKSSIKARTVNLGSARNPAGYNYTQGIPVDSTLGEVTVSVSGTKPRIQVFSPTGEQVTGPPQLETTLDLAEIMVVKVLQPEPGNWSITVGSAAEHSVKVVGLSNLTFHHGFSVQRPAAAKETSYRPLQGAYNYMLISLTEIEKNVTISFAEILTLDGKTLFEIPLKQVDSVNKVYLADAFLPPDEFFYIAINGIGENNQELRRVGATAIQAKLPEVPYLTVLKKVEAFAHQPVTLRCDIESLVPVSALWTRDGTRLQQQTSSLQSTSIQYVISEMGEESVGTYHCVARNVAGVSQATTVVELLVEPPVVTISASNTTLLVGDNLTVACTALTESVLTKYQMVFNGTRYHNVTEVSVEPNFDGVYHFNKTIGVTEQDGGVYSCIAANRGGQQSQAIVITVSSLPIAQILGPHTLPRAVHSLIQLICHVESCSEVQWLYNGSIVEKHAVNSSYNSMLEREMHGDGLWTCVALQGRNKASDSVEIIAVMKPEVSIEGVKNITILNGTEYTVTCLVKAKPTPRIVWHKETETFLNNTITAISPNLYKSVLTINSKNGEVNGTYFCFGENSEGIHQDSVTVDVRRAMTLIQGFSDISTQLYSNVSMRCQIDSYPKAETRWRHNSTDLIKKTNVHISKDGSSISIEKVNFDDLGLYSCEAYNGYEKLLVNGTLSVHGLETPVLSKEPSRVVTRKGNSTILTCRFIKGSPKPTLTWQYRTIATSFIQLSSDAIVSDDGTEMSITNTTIDHVGSYRCVAENVLGRDFYDVELAVHYAPQLKEISKQEPLEVELGKRVFMSCQAVGIPKPMVVWTKDEHPLIFTQNVHLTSDSDLVIEKADEYDSGLFSCNVTNIVGSTRKNFALLIYAPPKITRPGFEPPVDFLEGQLVELPCAAEGLPRPEVKWLQNGNPVTEDRKYIDDFGIRFVANLTDFGDYTCVVSNKHGNKNSTYAVYIWVPPTIEAVDEDVKVLVGANLSLNCDAVGFPIPTIRWEFQDTALVENSTNIRYNEYGNMNVCNVTPILEGRYSCVAENMVGVARKTFYVHIYEPPTIMEDNYTGSYIATDKDALLMITCKATGKPQPYVYWMKDDSYLDKDSRYDVDAHGTLTIKEPSPELSGAYLCKAKNVNGEANKTVVVEIYSLPAKMQADESNTKIGLLEGTNATVECPRTTGTSDVVTWYKDAKMISHGHLQLLNVSRDNSSQYACVVTNAVGSAYAKLLVEVEWPPKFTSEEAKEVEVVRGGDTWFDCGVDARPRAAIKWLFNSKIMLGEDKDRLKLMNIQLHHTGVYKCIVSNKHGTITRHFSLDVLVPPPIPKEVSHSINTRVGRPMTLECPIEGIPPPNVMWIRHPYSDVANTTRLTLSEDNATLVSTKSETTDSGLYSCVMSNKVGTTEVMFDVTIEKPPSIAGNVGANNTETRVVPLRRSVVLKCEVDGHPMPKISWLKDTQAVSSNTGNVQRVLGNSLLAIWRLASRDAGQYICVADNEAGSQHRRYNVVAQVPGKWSSWSQWSYCNVTCGLGYQARSRSCQYTDDYITIDEKSKSEKVVLDQSACKGPGSERRKCHMPPCEDETAQWSGWGKWSVCSSSCGAGTQARTRRCRRGRCLGDNVQIRRCPDLPKCEWESELSGNQTRSRSSTEDEIDTENDFYTPEATFEFQPEVVDAEENLANAGPQLSVYDVKVSSNPGQGYLLMTECDDIDECAITNNQCHSTQACVNTAGGYRCGCARGFYALGAGQRCLDINECAQGVDGCQYACVNVAGGHVCACPRHLRLHSDRRRCVAASSYLLPYQEFDNEFLSAMVEFPAKYKNTRN